MLSFKSLVSRVEEETLQELLGRPAMRLVNLLHRENKTAFDFKKILMDLHTPHDLLLQKKKRSKLLDCLRRHEAEDLAGQLDRGYKGDAFILLRDIVLRRGSAKEKIFLDFFGVSQAVENTEESHMLAETVESRYPLFPHQRKAIHQIKEKIYAGDRKVLLHMPTGSGKTRTAMNIIANHLINHEPTTVIWLAYSEELCAQAAEEFAKAWEYLGNREIRCFKLWGSHNVSANDIGDGILVAGLPKLYASIKSSIATISTLASKCSLIVIDEAHQAVAPTFRLVLDTLFNYNNSSSLLGLTATPGRSYLDIQADQELANFFSRQKVKLEIDGYSSPVTYLVNEGYLAEANYRYLDYAGNSDLNIFDLQQALDIPEEILVRLADDEIRNLQILRAVKDLATRHKRIIIFAATVEHANLLATTLRALGFDANSVTANTPHAERNAAISAFKASGNAQKILCNFGILTTGFDAPKTSAAVIARPTKSLVLYSQMVGRVTRGIKAGGNSHAEIVTVVDTQLPGFKDMVSAFENWEDVW